MHRPIHGLAAMLHPAYRSPSITSDIELLQDRDLLLSRLVPEEDHHAFLEELFCYFEQRGATSFQLPTCWKRESVVKPLFWWEAFGYPLQKVRRIALRVLAQDCSSGACERNWSSYSLIHTKIRNRLSTRQLERLVYCRHNLHMLRKMENLTSAKQVNVDTFKLTSDNLESVNTPANEDEAAIYRELYRELEEVDRRVSRTRGGQRAAITTTTSTARVYTRRGSSSRSSGMDPVEEDEPMEETREHESFDPEFDDDGNIIPSSTSIEPTLVMEDQDDSHLLDPLLEYDSDLGF